MVGAVDRKDRAVKPVEGGALRAEHRVDQVLLDRDMEYFLLRGQILDQGASQGHINQLHPTANAQNGLARPIKRPKQGQFGLVTGLVRGIGALVLLSVEGALDVAAAAQHKAGTAQIGGGAVTGGRVPSGAPDGGAVVVGPARPAGHLYPDPSHGRYWASWTERAFTRVTISSTAPSTPIMPEFRVRS